MFSAVTSSSKHGIAGTDGIRHHIQIHLDDRKLQEGNLEEAQLRQPKLQFKCQWHTQYVESVN
jgi:hypothetical protein